MMFTIGFKTLSSVRIPAVRSLERSAASRSLSSETGVVKFYVRRKGYGFITRDSTAEDIFVHRTEISGANLDDPNNPELRKGERVKFMIKENDGKSFATKVIMEDGSLVPKTREDWSFSASQSLPEKRIRFIKSRFGFKVYDLISEAVQAQSVDDALMEKIYELYTEASTNINEIDNSDSDRDAM